MPHNLLQDRERIQGVHSVDLFCQKLGGALGGKAASLFTPYRLFLHHDEKPDLSMSEFTEKIYHTAI
jgi:hypothetical protein